GPRTEFPRAGRGGWTVLRRCGTMRACRSSRTPRTGRGCWSAPALSAGWRPPRTPRPRCPTCWGTPSSGGRRCCAVRTSRTGRTTWSPLEYAAHVRDVCAVCRGRLALLLAEENPTFADWDQDAAAVAGRYGEKDPADVADELAARAGAVGEAFGAVPRDRWERSGLRSNGSRFTVRTLAQYFLHDVLHHLHDVGG